MAAATARPPFRLPSWQEHLADLRSRPSALSAVVHNLLPVFGIFVFGWSLPLVVATFWFDGLAALAVILAAIVPRALAETAETREKPLPVRALYAVFVWLILLAFVALPYWIVLIPLGRQILAPEVLAAVRGDADVWATIAFVVGSHVVAVRKRGFGTLPEKELKQALRWDVYLLVLRALAMFVVAGNLFPFLVVPVLAVLFSYMEIWPANALGIVFGDPSRLHEHDPGRPPAPPPPAPRGKRARLPP